MSLHYCHYPDNKKINVCLKQNYFDLNNKLYSSKEVLIMSNSLAPLKAETLSQICLLEYLQVTFWIILPEPIKNTNILQLH